MKTGIGATNARAKAARERIAALSVEHNEMHASAAAARAALEAVGSEPQAADFESSQGWSQAVFDWRRAHVKAVEDVRNSEDEARQHAIAAEIEAASAEIAAAEADRAQLMAEHFAAQADALAGQLLAAVRKFEATRNPNHDYGLKILKRWQVTNYSGVMTLEPSIASEAVIDLSHHALAAELS